MCLIKQGYDRKEFLPQPKSEIHLPVVEDHQILRISLHQRKFQLKMGLLTLTQLPCHHVLANEIALNLKYHIGLKQFFNINLGIGIIKKNYFFCLYFLHISPCFYSNFDRERLLDAELNSTSNEYPLSILLMDPYTPKTRNTWGSGVHQKYAEWVLVGCRI